MHDSFIYRSNFRRQGAQQSIYYWECIHNRKKRCRGRLKTIGDKLYVTNSNGERWMLHPPVSLTQKFTFSVPHNHESEDDRIDEARQKGCLHFKTLNEVAEEYDLKVSVRHDKDNDTV